MTRLSFYLLIFNPVFSHKTQSYIVESQSCMCSFYANRIINRIRWHLSLETIHCLIKCIRGIHRACS
jgi:hypothetical protein